MVQSFAHVSAGCEKAGFRGFFSTLLGSNLYGHDPAMRRFPIRGGYGKEFLRKLERASSVLQQVP